MKSFARNLVLAAAAVIALTMAAPARACSGDCDQCPRKAASKEDRKAAAPAPGSPANAPSPAADAKCHCEKGGKGCTCPPGKCDCENCGKAKKGA